ncbi:hypothetical protein DFJ73DRAFT_847043 [Zopfochytrium polystomum]|nr:hypothetical protein DFJ73DRAFT_847043 [Zopfochytrium polystomum]
MRLRILTSKMGNKNYYKGKGSGSAGHWDRLGQYYIDEHKLRRFVVPDISPAAFQLTPYVNPKIQSPPYRPHDVRDYFSLSALQPYIKDLDEDLVRRMRLAAYRCVLATHPKKPARELLEETEIAEFEEAYGLDADWGVSASASSSISVGAPAPEFGFGRG